MTQETNLPKQHNQELVELHELLAEVERRKHYDKFSNTFPDDGPCKRELYVHALKFFEAGKTFTQRALIAGNRCGKTLNAAYELTCHLTGKYPHWWNGKVWDRPVDAYIAGISNELTKEVLQKELFGSFTDIGSGMIPKECIEHTVNRPGVPETVLTARIKHYTRGIFDGFSTVSLKSYEQGRISFQGFQADIVVLDEEPRDPELKSECLMRLMTRRGILMCTFTPLFGLSKVVLDFMPGGRFPANGVNPENNSWVQQIQWEDVPHLTAEMKDEMVRAIPPWMRDARMRGIPQIGAGAIYPVSEVDITAQPFKIPDFWPRVYALDVGWHKTAAAWFTQDPGDKVWYLYSEHYQGRDEPPLHAQAIKVRGKWIPGVIDPASNRSRDDGSRLLEQYIDLGLDLIMADNSVEAGIAKVWQMLSSGELKIFSTCQNWFMEFRCYHKNDQGKIPDGQADHLMDCTRYFANTGQYLAMTDPVDEEEQEQVDAVQRKQALGASRITGY